MWSDGYVTEIEYTYGYYAELSPQRMQLALINAGIHANLPDNPTYLELGFGQGMSINIHAATTDGDFWGTDFSAGQTAFAQGCARASGNGARLFDQSFGEFAARDDLPEFDVITLHGIWSWISDENRATILDLIKRRLKPGGVVFVSYNCGPGWAAGMPLRHLLKEHAIRMGQGHLHNKVDGALDFIDQLIEAKARYFEANPIAKERLKTLRTQNKSYIAHEYLNDNWEIMEFAGVQSMLADAKLDFATTMTLTDHVDTVNLTQEAQQLLAGIEDRVLRETTRDYFVNQQFRRDVFVKGARPMTALEQVQAFSSLPFALLLPPEDVKLTLLGALGEVNLNEDVYKPILTALADEDYKPKTVAELSPE